METQFSRTELLLGAGSTQILNKAAVAVFGLGGVGGAVVEALARAGVGRLDLVDNDVISESNINRQIFALHSTLGRKKTEAAAERVRDINPACDVRVYNTFYLPETRPLFDFSQYSYVVDAVDTVTAKLDIIIACKAAGVPVISAMGAGNKLCASAFEAADIFSTSVCPLAKVMRSELKKRGIDSLKVVYSREAPVAPAAAAEPRSSVSRRPVPGSVPFVPPVAGFVMAGEIIKDIISAL